MDHQNQLGLGWLLTPSGGASSNSILFSNADHHGITTVTTVPASMMMTMENHKMLNDSVQRYPPQLHNHQQMQCGGIVGGIGAGPINYEIISKNLCHHNNQPVVSVPQPSVSSVAEGMQKVSNGETESKKRSVGNQMKNANKPLLDSDELAKRREINRLREKRRRDQMSPKERAKARKKNRLRARKRRKNMTMEEREEEKEKNRERARQRRAQKLQRK